MGLQERGEFRAQSSTSIGKSLVVAFCPWQCGVTLGTRGSEIRKEQATLR